MIEPSLSDSRPRSDPALEFRPLFFERAMVVRYWCEYLGQQFPWAGLDRNWFFAAQHALIDHILLRPDVQIWGAHVPGESDEILSYAVADPTHRVLHWIYTKSPYRRAHVATRLLERVFGGFDAPIVASHRTRAAEHRARAWNLRFDSYALGHGDSYGSSRSAPIRG
jgi:GNAT superfamily N-acetyltransferase